MAAAGAVLKTPCTVTLAVRPEDRQGARGMYRQIFHTQFLNIPIDATNEDVYMKVESITPENGVFVTHKPVFVAITMAEKQSVMGKQQQEIVSMIKPNFFSRGKVEHDSPLIALKKTKHVSITTVFLDSDGKTLLDLSTDTTMYIRISFSRKL